MNKLPELILERLFDAPREMVWRAWTDPQLVARWFGPNAETKIYEFDLKPGGLWLGEMKWGDKSNFSKVVFQEIVPKERLVWHESSSDSEWNVITNPMMPDWPRIVQTTVTFEDEGAKTKIHLSWTPHEASDAEIACFANAMEGFSKGWGAGFSLIDDILAELQQSAG